jgi:hypothetical protein
VVKQLVDALESDDAWYFWLALGFVVLMLLMVANSD